MYLRKALLTLLAIIITLGLGAFSIDELSEAYYMEDPELPSMAGSFFLESEDLHDLEVALYLWRETDYLGCLDFVEEQILKHPEVPKYRYLQVLLMDDPEVRVFRSRDMIEDFPDSPLGYNALLWSYLENYPLHDYFEDPELAEMMLAEDLPLFLEFGTRMLEEDNSLLAMIFYLVQNNRVEDAKPYLREAVQRKAMWLDQIDFGARFPYESCHGLIGYYIQLLLQQNEDYLESRIEETASMLAGFYFEESEDYDAVISYFGADPFIFQGYYVHYCLALSYWRQGYRNQVYPLLTQGGDENRALELLDHWRYFNSYSDTALEEMSDVYHEVLQPHLDEPFSHYLYIQTLGDPERRLDETRVLINRHPRLRYGYQLLTDFYFRTFANPAIDAGTRDSLSLALLKDERLIRNHYYRNYDDQGAIRAYLLLQVAKNDEARALKLYKLLRDGGMDYDTYQGVDAILALGEKLDLLMKAKRYDNQKNAEEGFIDELFIMDNTIIGYCGALYNNGQFQLLLGEVEKEPSWKLMEDLQYIIANSYYFTGDFDGTIDMLELMVEQGRIGTTLLQSMRDLDIASHPDWQALLDFAASRPDPDAVPEEEEETVDMEEIEEMHDWEDMEVDEELELDDFDPTDPEDIGRLLMGEDMMGEETGAEEYESLIGKPAPDWILEDRDGNLVTLSEQKGNIVILDFWASWCGPCLSAMPLIDQWMRENMPEGVKVFSINVWEDDLSAAEDFFTKNGFAMTMLLGNDEVAEAYRFPGIPFLCGIDREGIVQQVQLGYLDSLIDDLRVWIWFLDR